MRHMQDRFEDIRKKISCRVRDLILDTDLQNLSQGLRVLR